MAFCDIYDLFYILDQLKTSKVETQEEPTTDFSQNFVMGKIAERRK